MDCPTPFDDDDFFGSYDPEKAGGMSCASLDFDAAEAPPTPEQLAHWTRFRRPVAGVVAAMGLLSIVALGVRGTQQHGSERELVAHYGAAIAAPTSAPAEQSAVGPAALSAAMPAPSSDLVPEALSGWVLEALSVFVPGAPPATNTTLPALTVSATDSDLEPMPARVPALVPPSTALSELFTRPNPSTVKAFVPAPSPMCLASADSHAALGDANDAGASSQLTAIPISAPAAIRSAKPVAFAVAKRVPSAPAKPPASAAAPPAPFNSVARFPDARR